MRFESLLWTALALLLIGGGGWEGRTRGDDAQSNSTIAGGVSGTSPEFQAADGGSDIPPRP